MQVVCSHPAKFTAQLLQATAVYSKKCWDRRLKTRSGTLLMEVFEYYDVVRIISSISEMSLLHNNLLIQHHRNPEQEIGTV